MAGENTKKAATLVEGRIVSIRDCKVILDSDLALIYGVPTKRLNEQVRRNRSRFPDDFAFQLTSREVTHLKSQIATSSGRSGIGHGGVRKLPWVFTEHGAIMAANVLNSHQAIRMGVFVVRAFVRLREALDAHRDLSIKLDELERRVGNHDEQIQVVFDAIRNLMMVPEKPKHRIGFTAEEKRATYAVVGKRGV